MPSKSAATNDIQADATSSNALRGAGDARTRSAVKGAATVRRHKEEQRADSLALIRAQIADGTLVVRQMSATEHTTACQTASRARARSEARRKVSTGAGGASSFGLS
jgi:hypothetical protein